MRHLETVDETTEPKRLGNARSSGLVVVFSGQAPVRRVLELDHGRLTLGRESGPGRLLLDDARLSRSHARIERTATGWTIIDHGSRNGTYVDGVQVSGSISVEAPRVIRVGSTLIVPTDDVAAAAAVQPDADGRVRGERLARALADVALAARSSRTLLVQGESGTGKELAARLFHAEGPSKRGPFIAVNCAAIPTGLAERLLFGAKKGAYSGAAVDAAGHMDAAHGGVLFLDEAGELDLAVQAKLLRAIETSEVIALGASSGRQVEVRYCFATHRDLRDAVADGKFRADLYHRIAPPEVRLPPLRERLDEVPWHVHAEIVGVSPELSAHVKLVEACMLRPWPGNVRELRRQVRFAAERAHSETPVIAERGDAGTSGVVTLEHLSESAGQPFANEPPSEPGAEPRIRQYAPRREPTTKEQVVAALQKSQNNVAAAARLLGLHRNQFYREMQRWGIEVPK